MDKNIEEKRKFYVAKLKEQHRKKKSERISESEMKDLKKRIETLNKWIREG